MRTQKIALSGLMICLTLSGLALTGTGCSGTRYHRSTGAYLDDKGISTRVKTALFRDPLVSGFDVGVETFRGEVQLTGFVDSQQQKDRAAAIAREIAGVHEVVNNIEIKPGAETAVGTSGPGVQGETGTITQPVPERPASDQPMKDQPSHLAPVRSGSSERDLNSASGASGNYNEVGQFVPSTPERMATPAGVNTSSAPSNLEINASNGRATIRGTVSSDTEKQNIERRVRDIPGVQNVDNQLEVHNPAPR